MSENRPAELEIAPADRSLHDRLRLAPSWLGPLAALVVLVAAAGAMEPERFLRPRNLVLIGYSSSFKGIIAVGMALVIIAGGIDLSVGALLALAAATGVWLMNTVVEAPAILAAAERVEPGSLGAMYDPAQTAAARAATALGVGGSEPAGVAVAIAAMLLIGLAGGLINGLLIAKGRIPAFVATLGGLAAYRSLGVALTDSSTVHAAGEAGLFESIASAAVTTAPWRLPTPWGALSAPALEFRAPIFVFLAAAVVGHIVLVRTRFGRHVLAVGSNEQAARYSGIRPGRVRIGCYVLLGLLTAAAAVLSASRAGSVGAGQIGMMWELDVIAAVVIGGVRMKGGSGSIIGVVLGVLILGTIQNMLVLLDIPPELQGFVMGLVIVAAVLLQRGKGGAGG